MRYFIFILLILGCISCNQTRNMIQDDIFETSELYRISKIKNEKSFHVIYAERNDSIFQIFSNKTIASFDSCEKIKKGQWYNLRLKKILPPDSLLRMPYHYNIGIKTSWDKYIKEEYHSTVYEANNLMSLCLIKENDEK